MHLNVNFDLFCSLMSDITDRQRVFLDAGKFHQIHFSNFGLPNIYVRLCCELSGMNHEDFMTKKLISTFP